MAVNLKDEFLEILKESRNSVDFRARLLEFGKTPGVYKLLESSVYREFLQRKVEQQFGRAGAEAFEIFSGTLNRGLTGADRVLSYLRKLKKERRLDVDSVRDVLERLWIRRPEVRQMMGSRTERKPVETFLRKNGLHGSVSEYFNVNALRDRVQQQKSDNPRISSDELRKQTQRLARAMKGQSAAQVAQIFLGLSPHQRDVIQYALTYPKLHAHIKKSLPVGADLKVLLNRTSANVGTLQPKQTGYNIPGKQKAPTGQNPFVRLLASLWAGKDLPARRLLQNFDPTREEDWKRLEAHIFHSTSEQPLRKAFQDIKRQVKSVHRSELELGKRLGGHTFAEENLRQLMSRYLQNTEEGGEGKDIPSGFTRRLVDVYRRSERFRALTRGKNPGETVIPKGRFEGYTLHELLGEVEQEDGSKSQGLPYLDLLSKGNRFGTKFNRQLEAFLLQPHVQQHLKDYYRDTGSKTPRDLSPFDDPHEGKTGQYGWQDPDRDGGFAVSDSWMTGQDRKELYAIRRRAQRTNRAEDRNEYYEAVERLQLRMVLRNRTATEFAEKSVEAFGNIATAGGVSHEWLYRTALRTGYRDVDAVTQEFQTQQRFERIQRSSSTLFGPGGSGVIEFVRDEIEELAIAGGQRPSSYSVPAAAGGTRPGNLGVEPEDLNDPIERMLLISSLGRNYLKEYEKEVAERFEEEDPQNEQPEEAQNYPERIRSAKSVEELEGHVTELEGTVGSLSEIRDVYPVFGPALEDLITQQKARLATGIPQ